MAGKNYLQWQREAEKLARKEARPVPGNSENKELNGAGMSDSLYGDGTKQGEDERQGNVKEIETVVFIPATPESRLKKTLH